MTKKRVLSFKYALEGIFTALQDEPNLKFHFFASIGAIVAGFYFDITRLEWMVLLILIGLVIALELTNTAIEEVVNTFTPEDHPSAKKAKDVAAGAVLTASLTALLVGLIIFLPYLNRLFIY